MATNNCLTALMVALPLVLLARPTSAQVAPEIATSWGLVGTWNADCSKPRADKNTSYKFNVRHGELYLDRDSGRGADTSSIKNVKLNDDMSLDLYINFNTGERVHNLIKSEDSRIRIMQNYRKIDNSYSVKDGITFNNLSTPWMERCH